MLEKRNRNLCGVQDETVAECCCEPLKQKSGKSTLAALEPRLRMREDGTHLRRCREHYASARKGLNELAVGVPGPQGNYTIQLRLICDRPL
jgi:hypothetical protein